MAQEGADHDVLEDGHVLEGCGHLEGAADAEPRMRFGGRVGDVDAVEDDAPFARPQIAGDAVEEGRLAGAVGADEADDLARFDMQIGAGDRLEAAEGFRDLLGAKQHGGPRGAC